MADALHVTFTAGSTGGWHIERMTAVTGAGLPAAPRLMIESGFLGAEQGSAGEPLTTGADASGWVLRGAISNQRYTTADELARLDAQSPALNRPQATVASLIPITKSPAWWALAQDERREIFEETSHHIRRSMSNLPAVARRLHHSRDLGGPFDFLTWFEFAPEDATAFDDLLGALRLTPEWTFVEREVEVRVRRTAAAGAVSGSAHSLG